MSFIRRHSYFVYEALTAFAAESDSSQLTFSSDAGPNKHILDP